MKKEEKAEEIELEIKLRIPEELEEGRYSNYVNVGHSLHEFHIFFGQIRTPKQPSGDKIAYADAVAHIIIAPTVMAEVIKALSKNYERYKKRRAEGG